MKRIVTLASCLLIGLSICSCSSKIDYSNNPYIGASGSGYVAVASSSSETSAMAFFFKPNGTGAWAYATSVDDDVVGNSFCYTISGDVNVSIIEDDTDGKIYGYFTTLSDIGQCFVTRGLYFARYS